MSTSIRNVAIIAHVDHGKTTLVDALLKQSNTFHEKAEELTQELIMDSNPLERERGITILAKNTAIEYQGVKINIIDTPGHADFGGEVERTFNMADGCLLIIDAQEGPMPQTRSVLRKALLLNLKVIVVINKIDKKFARVAEVIEETNNLFLDLAIHENQLNFPILYAIGRLGKAFYKMPDGTPEEAVASVEPIFETIIKEIPAPTNNPEGDFQMLVTNLDYDDFRGRYLIGRVHRGMAEQNLKVTVMHKDGTKTAGRLEKVFTYQGLGRVEVKQVFAGDIIALTGIPEAGISDTIADVKSPEALPPIAIEEPTLKITVAPNTSPFVGQDGKFLTSRQIQERLEKELEKNVSLKMELTPQGKFLLSGRGELHLSVLIETLRREGYELEVSKPEVILKEENGVVLEPLEEVTIDIPKNYAGVITAELGKRQAKTVDVLPHVDGFRYVYEMPTRSLLGLRSFLMTETRGTVVLNSTFLKYAPQGAALSQSRNGVLIVAEGGIAVSFGLEVAQGRGITFIPPQTPVYEGMIIGENGRAEDITINVCKARQLTNFRTAGHEYSIQLAPPKLMTLEEALDFIEEDELLEVTPKNIRLRKKYLTRNERSRYEKS